MLRHVLKLLTTPIKRSRTNTDRKISHPKPLMLQTIYPGTKTITGTCQSTLPNQYKISEILLNRPAFKNASIEICQLDESFSLVGLTHHPKTEMIMGCIFMYPDSIKQTDYWQHLLDKAVKQQTGIAAFKPNRIVNCFKILLHAEIQPDVYLIHHRDISAREWLHTPPKL